MHIHFKNKIKVSDYNALRASAGWKEIEPPRAKKGIQNAVFVLAAYDGRKCVGMLRVVGDGGYYCFIVDVAVLPAYRGQGIGKSLVSKTITHVKKSIPEGGSMYLGLFAACGREGFYEQFGFVKRPDEDKSLGAGMTVFLKND